MHQSPSEIVRHAAAAHREMSREITSKNRLELEAWTRSRRARQMATAEPRKTTGKRRALCPQRRPGTAARRKHSDIYYKPCPSDGVSTACDGRHVRGGVTRTGSHAWWVIVKTIMLGTSLWRLQAQLLSSSYSFGRSFTVPYLIF